MQTITITIPIDQLQAVISDTIQREMQRLEPTSSPEPEEYITRKETADLLRITLPTLNLWTRTGKLKAYRIGTRVRYRRSEILKAFEQVGQLKFKR